MQVSDGNGLDKFYELGIEKDSSLQNLIQRPVAYPLHAREETNSVDRVKRWKLE